MMRFTKAFFPKRNGAHDGALMFGEEVVNVATSRPWKALFNCRFHYPGLEMSESLGLRSGLLGVWGWYLDGFILCLWSGD